MTSPAGRGNRAVASERYLVGFDTRDLPRYSTDILVVGGGVAGLSAALAAAKSMNVLVLHKDVPALSNTSWAQGGIAAAVAPDDDPDAHADDTLRTGCGLCDTELVREIAAAAPTAVRQLADSGARFDRAADGATFALGREGGHGAARILHAGDTTGAECSRTLITRVREHARISEKENAYVIDLITADAGVGGTDMNGCVGALVQGPSGRYAVFARAVVLATGGAGQLFRETSNVPGATGDGIAAAYRAGVSLRDMEFVQFHPTTLYLAGVERVLVTEAVRGDGALLIDNHGDRFLKDVHPDAELAPRDIVSRALLAHLARPGVFGIFLDMRHWPKGHVAGRFPGLARTCAHYGLDPERDPIPVRPAAHYTIGGVRCDHDGATDLPGLFACGEAACSGLHGANRLASNSLLEGLVLGPRVGAAAARAAAVRGRFLGDVCAPAIGRRRGSADFADLRRSLISRMWRSAGVTRDAEDLGVTAAAIAEWRGFMGGVVLEDRSGFEVANLLLLGGLMVAAATAREESRGTHDRKDYPERDDARFLGSFCWRRGAPARFVGIDRTGGGADGILSRRATPKQHG